MIDLLDREFRRVERVRRALPLIVLGVLGLIVNLIRRKSPLDRRVAEYRRSRHG